MDEEQQFLEDQQWAQAELMDLVDIAIDIDNLDSPTPRDAVTEEALRARLVETAASAHEDPRKLGGVLLASIHLHRALLRGWAQETGRQPDDVWRQMWPNN